MKTLLMTAAALLLPLSAAAHCDTLGGPIAKEAAQAFEKRDPAALLKWVRPQDEAELKAGFERARKVAAGGKEAKALAERWFLENLVRLHRAGEGAAYTGLKDGKDLDPALLEADEAVEKGTVDALADALGAKVAAAVRERFEALKAAKIHAGDDPASGRVFVRAYVEFLHFVEGLHGSLGAEHAHGSPAAEP